MAAAAENQTFGEREVTITRTFDAPCALVFKAWTDPAELAQWWGPQGFTNPVCEFEARMGGALRIHMRAPDGTIYPMRGAIREIIAAERLVFSFVAVDASGNHLLEGLTTATFASERGETKLTLHSRAVAVTEFAVAYLQGMEIGWTQSVGRLAALVSRAA